ncbi:MAG: hypothetical protein RR739_10100, partial [Clostridia bacterium]
PPAGTVAASLQVRPDKPLFDAPIVKSHDVLPPAKADTRTPLPPAAPLPQATAVAPSTTAGTDAQGGAVNPAAGMAAAVTDSKGEQHDDKRQRSRSIHAFFSFCRSFSNCPTGMGLANT